MGGGMPLAFAAPHNKDTALQQDLQGSAPLFYEECLSNDGWLSTAVSLTLFLSQVSGSITSQGGSSFGHNLLWDIAGMLHVSPHLVRGSFGFVFLDTHERVHQDPPLAYFNSARRSVHVISCPNFKDFLWSSFLHPCNVSFISNLPNIGYILSTGCRILQDIDYSQDVALNLSWLPLVLLNPSTFQEMLLHQAHPYVSACVPSKPGCLH
jgi:hypothetical protein